MKKKKEQDKGEMTSESNVEILIHENGIEYRELQMNGLDEPIKLFNSIKPNRLEGETYTEYRIRRKLIEMDEKQKVVFYNSSNRIPYVKNKNLI